MNITPEQAKAELARRELVRRGVSEEKSQSVADSLPDAVKSSLINLTSGMASRAKDLATNPETMAKAMPAVLGASAAMIPYPGAGTIMTGAGQGIRDAALAAMNKTGEIPSGLQHAMELGGAAVGDLTAFPAINKARLGGEIGQVEKAAGVPPVQDMRSTPMSLGPKSVGDYINDAMDSVKSYGGKGTPTFWKQIKDQVDRIYELGKDAGLTAMDKGRLKFLSQTVQSGLNSAVEGRGPIAADLARSQIIPNTISKGLRAIPSPVKTGLGIGAGTATGGGLIYELMKALGATP